MAAQKNCLAWQKPQNHFNKPVGMYLLPGLARLPETGELCQTALALRINTGHRSTDSTDSSPSHNERFTRSQSDWLCWRLNSGDMST
jgi:hypothetical protein